MSKAITKLDEIKYELAERIREGNIEVRLYDESDMVYSLKWCFFCNDPIGGNIWHVVHDMLHGTCEAKSNYYLDSECYERAVGARVIR